jgi:hypothetical protein
MNIMRQVARDTLAVPPGTAPPELTSTGVPAYAIIMGIAALVLVGLWLWHRSRPGEL